MHTRKIALPLLLIACGIYAQAQKNESVSPPPPSPPKPPKTEQVKFAPPKIRADYEAFYNRNKNVSNLTWKNGNMVTVHLKDKSQEKYDLSDNQQKKLFTDKYGENPAPPPPPPPIAPRRNNKNIPPPPPPAPPKGKIKSPPPPPEPPKAGTVKFAPPVIVKDK